MTTAYVDTGPNDLLGSGAYYIITLRRGASLFGGPVFDSSFVGAVRAVHEKLAGTGLAFPIVRGAVTASAREVAVDVRTSRDGANALVGELVSKVEQVAGGAVDVVRVRRVRGGQEGTKGRAELRKGDLVEAAKAGPAGLAGMAERVALAMQKSARLLIGVLVLAVVAYVIFSVVRARR